MPDGAGDIGEARGSRTAPVQAVADVVARQPGQPLAPVVRARLEAVFDRDLGDVRVHTGAEAAQSARSVDANAWTVGNHMAFAPGQYAPDTETGLRLLRHEVSHVVQQGGRTPTVPTRLSSPGDAAERAADAVAAGAAPGAALVATGEAGVVHRQVAGAENRATHGDPRDPHNPDNTLTDREMYELWKGYWQRRLGRALDRERAVRKRIWREDPVGYADDTNKFEQGLRSALGPEYEAAADELAFCQAITTETENILNWLEGKETQRATVTLDEVDARALAEARSRHWSEMFVLPLFMLFLAEGPRLRGGSAPHIPGAPVEAPPPARPAGGTGFRGAIRKVTAAGMIGLSEAEPVTQGPAAGGPPRAAVTDPPRPVAQSPSPAGGRAAVTERPTATVRPQQSTVAPSTADARPAPETTTRTAPPPKAPAKASPATSATAPKAPAAGFDAAGRQRAAEKLAGKEQAVAAADASVPSHEADQRSAQGGLLKQAGERPVKPASLKARLGPINGLPTYDDKVEAVRKLRLEAGLTAAEKAYLDWLSRNYALMHDFQDSGGAAKTVTDVQLPAVTQERDAAQKALNQARKSLNELMRSNGPNYKAAGRIQVDQVMSLAAWNAEVTKPKLATDHLVSLDRITELRELRRLLAFYAQAPAEVQELLRNELAALGDLPDNLVRMRADANGSSLKSNKSWADIPYAKAAKFGYSVADVDAIRAREAQTYADILRRIEELTAKYTKRGAGQR
ncbi:eCIS core domain-containing protein [Streptomyces sp. NPDC001975]